MATLGRLVMGLFLDSNQAEKGLDRARKKFLGLTKTMANFAKVATGVYLAQTAFGAAQWVSNQFAGVIESGAKLETTAAQFAYLNNSWEKGLNALNNLRDTSKDTGTALGSLTDAYSSLVNAGVDSQSSLETIQGLTKAAVLFGGDGSAGIGKMVGAIVEFQETALATPGSLKVLQQGGLRVYQSLAAQLTRVTGRAHDAHDAMVALRNGAVLSGTAIDAIQSAAKSPQVEEAAKRFATTFEGQKHRMVATLNDVWSLVGKGLIDKIGLTRITSWLNGFLRQGGNILEEILKKAGVFEDNLKNQNGIEKAFEAGKQAALFTARILGNAAITMADTLDQAGINLQNATDAILQAVNAAKNLGNFVAQNGNILVNAGLAAGGGGWVGGLMGQGVGALMGRRGQGFWGKFLGRAGWIAGAALAVNQAFAGPNANLGNNNPMALIGPVQAAGPNPKFAQAKLDFENFLDNLQNNQQAKPIALNNLGNVAGGIVGLFRGLVGGGIERNAQRQVMNGMVKDFVDNAVNGIGKIGDEWANFTENIMPTLQKAQKKLRVFIDENAPEIRNPLENFFVNFRKTADILKQLTPAIEKTRTAAMMGDKEAAKVDNALSTIFVRKFGGLLQGLLSEYSPTESFSGNTALGGSAAAVESIVRAAYSESNADPQARIETAIKRGNIIAERNLQYQMRLIAAMERSMGPAAIVRL